MRVAMLQNHEVLSDLLLVVIAGARLASNHAPRRVQADAASENEGGWQSLQYASEQMPLRLLDVQHFGGSSAITTPDHLIGVC